MHSVAGVYDGEAIRPTEAFEARPNTRVIITFLDDAPSPFPPTRLEDVAGCLPHRGPARTVEEMNEAVVRHAREHTR
jgi:hypothetical protein